MATRDDIVVGSWWRAKGPHATSVALDRGGPYVEVCAHSEAECTAPHPESVVIRWANGLCRPWSHWTSFLNAFDLVSEEPQPQDQTSSRTPKTDPYSAGPNGETAGYLAGLTGNRWL